MLLMYSKTKPFDLLNTAQYIPTTIYNGGKGQHEIIIFMNVNSKLIVYLQFDHLYKVFVSFFPDKRMECK